MDNEIGNKIMDNKSAKSKNSLNKLLTTVSVLAMVTAGAGDALGVGLKTTGGDAKVSDGTDWDNAPTDGDNLKMGNDGDSIDFNGTGGNTTFLDLDLNGKSGTSITVTEDLTIGSIHNGGTNTTDVAILTGKILTFNGTAAGANASNYTGVGAIDMGGDGTLLIDDTAGAENTLNGAFTNAASATLTLTTSLVATDNTVDNVTKIKTISVANNKKLTIAPAVNGNTVTDIELLGVGGSTITFGGADAELMLESKAGAQNVFQLKNDFASGQAAKGVITLKAAGHDGHGQNSSLVLKADGEKAFGNKAAALANTFKSLTLEADATATLSVAKGVVLKTAKLVAKGGGKVTIADKSVAALTGTAGIVEISGQGTNLVFEGGGYAGDQATDVIAIENAAGDVIADDAASIWTLSNANTDAAQTKPVTFKLMNNADLGVGCIVALSNTSAGSGKLVLDANGGAKTLGTVPQPIVKLLAQGTKPITITKDVTLNVGAAGIIVYKGADLTVGYTAADKKATIGEAIVVGQEGAAKYIIDLAGKGGGGAVAYDAAAGGGILVLKHHDAVFGFTNSGAADETVNFTGHINSGAADKGILQLSSGTKKLKLITAAGGNPKQIGVDATPNVQNIQAVNITGGIVESDTNLKINTSALNVKLGSFETANAAILKSKISIGVAAVGTTPKTDGTLIVSTADDIADFGVAGEETKLNTADSQLQMVLAGAPGGGKAYTLKNNIVGTDDLIGKVTVGNTSNGKLTVKDKKIGAADKRLKSFDVSGDREIEIESGIFAKEVTVSSTGPVTFSGAVRTVKDDGTDPGSVNVTAATTAITFGAVEHNIGELILGNAGNVVKLVDGPNTKIIGDIFNKTADEAKTKIEFLGSGEIVGNIGAADATKNYKSGIEEIKFSGDNTKTAKITGDVIAKKMTFGDASNVEIVGNFTGDVDFNDNDAKITFSNGKFDGKIDQVTNDDKATVIFSGKKDIEVTGSIGETKMLKAIHVDLDADKVLALKAGIAGVKDIKYLKGSSIISDGDIKVTGGKLDFDSQKAFLTINAGKSFEGEIDNGQNAKVSFASGGKLTGKIGASQPLGILDVKGQVDLLGNVEKKISKVIIDKDGTLKISGTGPVSIRSMDIDETSATGGVLKLTDDTPIKYSTFGQSDRRIKSVEVEEGKTPVLTSVYIFANEIKGKGKLHYTGGVNTDNTLDVEVKKNTLKGIKVDAGVELYIKKNLDLDGEIDLENGSVLKIAEYVESIKATAIGDSRSGGSLELNNEKPLTIHASLGKKDGNLGTVDISGNNVDFSNPNFYVNAIVLSTVQDIDVKIAGVLDNTDVSNTGDKFQHRIFVSQNQDIKRSFGSQDKPIGDLVMTGGSQTVTLGTDHFYGGIKSQSGGGKVVLNALSPGLTAIGDEKNKVSSVEVKESGIVVSDIHSRTIKVDGTAQFTGLLDTNALTILPQSLADLPGARPAHFAVFAEKDGEGSLALGAQSEIFGNIGTASSRLASVSAMSGDATFSNSKMFAKDFSFGKHTYDFTKNLEINGNTSLAGSVLDIGDTTLTFSNGNVNVTGDTEIKIAVTSGRSSGQLKLNLGSGKNFDLSGAGSLTVTFDSAGSSPVDAEYDFINVVSGAIQGADKLVVGNDNSSTSASLWEIVPAQGNKIRVKRTSQVETAFNNVISGSEVASTSVSAALAAAVEGSEAAQSTIQFDEIEQALGATAAREARERFDVTVDSSEVVSNVVSAAQNAVISRVVNITPAISVVSVPVAVPVAAPVSFGPVSSGPATFATVAASPTRGAAAPAASAGGASVSGRGAATSGGATPATSTGGSGSSSGGSGSSSGGSGSSSSGNDSGSGGSGGSTGDSKDKKQDTKNREESTAYENQILTGVAAGDADRYGVWGSPFYNQSVQKTKKQDAGYKSVVTGGSVGFDVLASDDAIVGAAFTFADTNVNHRDHKKGDKTKVTTLMGTVYGLYQLTNQYYVQAAMSFGTSSVVNDEHKDSVSNGRKISSVSRGKYNSMTVGGEIMAGYNHVVNNSLVLTPSAGISITRMNDESYKETGDTVQNRQVNKKANTKYEILAGIRASMVPSIYNGVSIAPELHANARYDVRGKGPRVEIVQDTGNVARGNILSSSVSKTEQFSYSAGAGLNLAYGSMEYGLSYDAQFANKYLGHQGSLKIKVNF